MQLLKGILTALVLAAAYVTAAAAATACDCNAVEMTNQPVCAADGNTFMNKCLAECQGMAAVHDGPCTSSSGPLIAEADAAAGALMRAAIGADALEPAELGLAAAAAATVALGFADSSAGTVTPEQMSRYADEGMVLVGVLNPVKDFDPSDLPKPDTNKRTPSVDEATGTAAEVSVTPADGCIFKMRMPLRQVVKAKRAAARAQVAWALTAAAATDSASHQAAAGAAAAGTASLFEDAPIPPAAGLSVDTPEFDSRAGKGGRRLKTVFGKDDRQQITSPQQYPYNTVGLISFTVDGMGKGCTGALIGSQAVLTAAHCVCSARNKDTVAATWRFAANHIVSGPDARYGWTNAVRYSFNTGFWTTEWWLYDIALVTIDKPLGDIAGAMGYAWSPDGVNGNLATAGYPGDKLYGSYWSVDAGACTVTDNKPNSVMLVHKCDVYAGQSGSPQWKLEKDEKGVSTRVIRAVINAETPDYNSSMKINQSWFNFIKERRSLKK